MRVILIAGPTASGKSSAAIGVAQACNGTIINADSMQVYKELQVLTSRPSVKDEKTVEHRMYGYLRGSERCTVARWLDDVSVAIAETIEKGKTPVLVGGTGLYFKGLESGLAPVPEIPQQLRQRLKEQLELEGPKAMHEALAKLDEIAVARLEENDSQRILRALEVVMATGKTLSHYHQIAAQTSVLANHDVQKFTLCPPRELLYERINQRFDEMLDEGALEEVKTLRTLELQSDLPIMKAIGVRSLGKFLDGECELDFAIEKAKQETRNYAKRQMTWQRNQMAAWNICSSGIDVSLIDN